MLRVPALILSLSGIAGLGELLVHPLVEQVRRHLAVELVVEPGDQPPRLGAQRRAPSAATAARAGLLEILEDRRRIRQHQVVDLQHRHLARGVHPQEVHPPLPGLLLDQLDLDLLLRQHQAESCGRTATAADGRDGALRALFFARLRHLISVAKRARNSTRPVAGQKRPPGHPPGSSRRRCSIAAPRLAMKPRARDRRAVLRVGQHRHQPRRALRPEIGGVDVPVAPRRRLRRRTRPRPSRRR